MQKEIVASTMKLKLVAGHDAQENPQYSTRSFKDIRTDLSDEDMLSVGTALAGLQSLPLGQVLRTDTGEFIPR